MVLLRICSSSEAVGLRPNPEPRDFLPTWSRSGKVGVARYLSGFMMALWEARPQRIPWLGARVACRVLATDDCFVDEAFPLSGVCRQLTGSPRPNQHSALFKSTAHAASLRRGATRIHVAFPRRWRMHHIELEGVNWWVWKEADGRLYCGLRHFFSYPLSVRWHLPRVWRHLADTRPTLPRHCSLTSRWPPRMRPPRRTGRRLQTKAAGTSFHSYSPEVTRCVQVVMVLRRGLSSTSSYL